MGGGIAVRSNNLLMALKQMEGEGPETGVCLS